MTDIVVFAGLAGRWPFRWRSTSIGKSARGICRRMKPPPFDYVVADSVEAAVAALGQGDAKIIAGGQSLVPMLNFRLLRPSVLRSGERRVGKGCRSRRSPY